MDISKISAKGSQKNKMVFHEDEQSLHIGTLDKRCYFIPFSHGQDPFADRELSRRFELLNGEWDFRYYKSIIDMEDNFISVPYEKKYRCRLTGSFTDTTNRSTPTSVIPYPTTRLMFPTIFRWVFTAAAIAILPTGLTGYSFSRALTAAFIFMLTASLRGTRRYRTVRRNLI